ncbi:manganese efflux pump MntP family protein [Lysobacter sp. GX 14042]|uniref:manganese efflux pump MntP n=1 Tax=Lysobacter sp. GX 14042 TaxID=2907155 RepID=UPI001F3E6988|nr:manganese efflux pump MntP family protein [Lysobacter sp. GX 14042]MCE7031565.1 manganese efflux pump MntP family protein [Lysobacter sp. GX 14042]
MSLLSILLLGLAMSTDAFAAALGKGAGMPKPRWGEALRVGLIFGVVEALTPIVGWLLGSAASRFVEAWAHWIAFGLLAALGLHMIYKAVTATEHEPSGFTANSSLLVVALTGLATSIDAMAVGVGLAFVDVNIATVAAVIGLCTFALVTVGVMVGHVLGTLIGKRAEIAGGLVLIAVGAMILYEHISSAAG